MLTKLKTTKSRITARVLSQVSDQVADQVWGGRIGMAFGIN